MLRGIADDFITTLYPGECRVCDAPLVSATPLPVCDACQSGLVAQQGQLCGFCGEAIETAPESLRLAGRGQSPACPACIESPPPFAQAAAYAVYQGTLREMIHLLKYERMSSAARPLGVMLAETILSLRQATAGEVTVVAVPLFAAKQRQRGYNQAELLADAAIPAVRRAAPDWILHVRHNLLVRVRDTESQFALGPAGRQRNLRGAFELDCSAMPAGGEVLLIDDIYTTGATARECTRVLIAAGASRVWVATVARAQVPRVSQIALWNAGAQGSAQGFG